MQADGPRAGAHHFDCQKPASQLFKLPFCMGHLYSDASQYDNVKAVRQKEVSTSHQPVRYATMWNPTECQQLMFASLVSGRQKHIVHMARQDYH